ncbi:MAG: phosphatase PAP2 family protein [Oligoflexus sp.]|nr:phosphatase PAP2 family protein [Pseudopedobacter sp.]
MSHNEMMNFDEFITNHIIFYRSPHLNIIMKYITFVGDIFGYIILCVIFGLFFYFKKNWRVSLQITLVLVLASGINVFLKNFISRPRPLINRIMYANFYSFPSGHAMSAIVFYGFISYLSLLLLNKTWQKGLIITFCILMIFAIGISRIYLGVHYPSDILAGYLAGMAWLMFCLVVLNILTLRKIRLNSYK